MKIESLIQWNDSIKVGTIVEAVVSPNMMYAHAYDEANVGWTFCSGQFEIMPEETISPAFPPEKSDKRLYDFCGGSAKKITIEFYEVKK